MHTVGLELTHRLEAAGITLEEFARRTEIPLAVWNTLYGGWQQADPMLILALARYWGNSIEYWASIQMRTTVEQANSMAAAKRFNPHSAYVTGEAVQINIG